MDVPADLDGDDSMAGLKGIFNRLSGGKKDEESQENVSESDSVGSQEYHPLKVNPGEVPQVLGGAASFDGLLAEGEKPTVERYLSPEKDGVDCIMRTKSGVMIAVRFVYDPDMPDGDIVRGALKGMTDNGCTVAVVVSETGFTEESVEEAMYLEVLLVDYCDFEKGDF